MSGILSFFSGWQGYLIGGLMLFAAGGASTGYVVHKMDASTIADMKTADAQATIKAINIADASDKKQAQIDLDAAVKEAKAQDALFNKLHPFLKEIPKYVTVKQDAIVCITVGLARSMRAAAAGLASPGAIALAPAQSDDDCSDVSATEMASWFKAYATVGQQNAEQLNDLEANISNLNVAQGGDETPPPAPKDIVGN